MPKDINIKVRWRYIKGYGRTYLISDLGSIINAKRLIIRKNYLTKAGYVFTILSLKGKKKTQLVHRLVASAFIPNAKKLPVINHKNEIKNDNSVDNLEWCTQTYNANYGTRNKKMAATQTNGSQSKEVLQLLKGVIVRRFPSTAEAGRQGYDHGSVSRSCRTGTRHSGYNWRYA